MPGFDFRALAARARADNPDAALFEALETFGDQERVYNRERRGEAMWRAVAAAQAAEKRIADARPATVDGLLAKLRHAFDRGRRSRTRGGTMLNLQRAAALDAIAWLEGRGRAGAPDGDAALLEAIEADRAAFRDFSRAMARLRRLPVNGRCDAFADPGDAIHRSATGSREARDRVAATRPATLEGLVAKLRHAERMAHRCPAFNTQHAALLDAIAWLGPPKRKAKVRHVGTRAVVERSSPAP